MGAHLAKLLHGLLQNILPLPAPAVHRWGPSPPLASLPGRSRHVLPRVGADALSPTWFRLRAAPSWAYKFLSDRLPHLGGS